MAQMDLTHSDPLVFRTPVPVPVWQLMNPMRLIRALVPHRELITQFAMRDVQQKHRGSHLGLVWTGLAPLLMLAVYVLVFNTIFKARLNHSAPEGPLDYAVMLYCGLMVFQIFMAPVSRAPKLIVSKMNFVKKMIFPLEILPVSVVLSSLVYSSVGLVLVLVAHFAMGGRLHAAMLLFPVVMAPAILLAVGLGWILSALGVFLRDIDDIVNTVVQRMMFLLTPLFYSIESVPEHLRVLVYLNPLSAVVDGARKTLLMGEQPNWMALGIWTAIALVVCQVGYAMFERLRRGFADVL